MDLRDLDAASVAGRVAQVAAADLYGVLTCTDAAAAVPVQNWFAGFQLDHLEEIVGQLAATVIGAKEPVSGERLYRSAAGDGIVPRGHWAELPFPAVAAWCLFAAICRAVHIDLQREQQRLDALAYVPPPAVPLPIEDSILEEAESFDKLVPYGQDMLETMGKVRPAPAPEAAQPPAEPKKPRKPMAIGEAPPRHAGNVGGRGKQKS